MSCNPLHLLDVYDCAWTDHEDAQTALKVVGSYLEQFSSTNGHIPWQAWFNPRTQVSMELLCRRLVLDDSQRYAHAHASSSMGHWRAEMLLDCTLAQRLRPCAEDVPEQTWHDLFRLHGRETALVFTRQLLPTDSEHGILEQALIKQHKSIVLALHLGMFTDNDLGSEQGLHGQSLTFWAKRMAVVAGKDGWTSFCAMYPWAGPILVHRCLNLAQLPSDCAPFISLWSRDYSLQAQALQTYLHSRGELYSYARHLLLPATVDVEDLTARQQLMESMYPQANGIAAYMENYQSIFATSMTEAMGVELPCLEPYSN